MIWEGFLDPESLLLTSNAETAIPELEHRAFVLQANAQDLRLQHDEIIAAWKARAAFEDGWRINWIRAAVFEGRWQPAGYLAWLSSITRV